MKAVWLLVLVPLAHAYSEKLDMWMMGKGHLVASFSFDQSYDSASPHPGIRDYGTFPREIVELVERYDVEELKLAMTVGRWLFDEWGHPGQGLLEPAPTGIYLHARLKHKSQWKSLLSTLSGLFCASISQELQTAEPRWRQQSSTNASGVFMQTLLPREPVCTENLTPMLRMLPCANLAGLASILNPRKVFDNRYHSLQVGIVREEHTIRLCIQLAMVVNWQFWRNQRAWTLGDVFDRDFAQAQCFGSPRITLHMPANASFQELAVDEGAVLVDDHTAVYADLNSEIGMLPAEEWDERFEPAPIHIHRAIIGTDLVQGVLVTSVTNRTAGELPVVMQQMLPWYMPITLHDMQITVNDAQRLPLESVGFFYAPAVDRRLPAELELSLNLPPRAKVVFRIRFDKVLLRIDEYPPDRHRGFDINPALVYLPSKGNMRFFTTPLLLPLAVPDDTMPYNVIMLVSTLMALFFGMMFNFVFQRVYLWLPGDVPVGRKRRLKAAIRGAIGRAAVFLCSKVSRQKTE